MQVRFAREILAFLLLSCLHSSGQKLRFDRYTTAEGLLSDEVYNLHQDRQGYIWVFTSYGTLKYNSVEFKPVLVNLPFSEAFIYSIFENSRGDKWVANSHGKIFRVINDSAYQVPGTDSVSHALRSAVSEIYSLYADDSLNLYATTKSNSYKFLNREGRYIPVLLNRNSTSDSVIYQALQMDERNYMAVHHHKGKEQFHVFNQPANVGMWLSRKNRSIYYPVDKISRGAPKFFKSFGKYIYFNFYEKLGRIDEKDHLSYIPLKHYITNFTQDENKHKWVACLNDGLYELDERDSVINHYFEGITVNDVLADSDNGLWASTTGGGLYHCNNINNLHYDNEHPLGKPISFIKLLGNELFVGNQNGDIYRLNSKDLKLISSSSSLEEPNDIIRKGDGFLIARTYCIEEVQPSQDGNYKVVETNRYTVNPLQFLYLKGDSLIYLQRKSIGIVVKNDLKKKLDFGFKTYTCIREGGTYLIGTEDGLYVYDRQMPPDPIKLRNELPIVPQTLGRPADFASTAGVIIRQLVKEGEEIWVCSTGSGLFKLDKNRHLSNYTEDDGLPGNIIGNISFSGSNVLLSTTRGLYITKKLAGFPAGAEWRLLAGGEVKNAIEFGDKIYAASRNGLLVLNSDNLNGSNRLHFNFSGLNVNSEERPISGPLAFRYFENNPRFSFDLIDFSNNERRMVYHLTGPVNDSGRVQAHSLNFQNLPPGSYKLSAYPGGQSGDKHRIEIPFTIIPAFWQTTTFFVLITGLSIILVAILSWLIFRNYRLRQEKRNQAEKLILEYKLIALKAQVNPHFVSNCLSAIQHLIIDNKLEAATLYIAKFGLLVRKILNFSTRSLVTVKEELDIARLNIELEQLRFERKFNYDIEVGKEVDQESVFVPALILNPIIENAIWHGLLPLKGRRQADLRLKVGRTEDKLLITIEDNGVGRKAATMAPGNTRESKGIKLTEQRLANINYLYNINSSAVVYSDLNGHDGLDCGTRVEISLPAGLKPIQNE